MCIESKAWPRFEQLELPISADPEPVFIVAYSGEHIRQVQAYIDACGVPNHDASESEEGELGCDGVNVWFDDVRELVRARLDRCTYMPRDVAAADAAIAALKASVVAEVERDIGGRGLRHLRHRQSHPHPHPQG